MKSPFFCNIHAETRKLWKRSAIRVAAMRRQLPLGAPVENTSQPQRLKRLRVYPGADADFTLYDDDGKTYAYENGESRITHLHWSDATQKLTQQGVPAWEGSGADLIDIVGSKYARLH